MLQLAKFAIVKLETKWVIPTIESDVVVELDFDSGHCHVLLPYLVSRKLNTAASQEFAIDGVERPRRRGLTSTQDHLH